MRLALAQFRPPEDAGPHVAAEMRRREERRAAPNEAPTPVAYGSVHVRFPSIQCRFGGGGKRTQRNSQP